MQPNPLAIFLLCLGGAAALVFLLWLNHKLRGRPKSEERPEEGTRPAQEAPTLTSQIMSRLLGAAGPIEEAATPLPATSTSGGQRIAKPGNVVNDGLTGNVLPEEVREVMRFWAMVEVAERVIKSGKMGTAEAIETVFNCKRSGRPDSVYARARAALNARSEASYRERQDRLVELQTAATVED
jgi:hypothetical protein